MSVIRIIKPEVDRVSFTYGLAHARTCTMHPAYRRMLRRPIRSRAA